MFIVNLVKGNCKRSIVGTMPQIGSTGKDDVISTGGKPTQHNDCIRLINTVATSACVGVDTASCNWLKEMSSGSFSLDKAAFLILVSSAKTGSFTESISSLAETRLRSNNR